MEEQNPMKVKYEPQDRKNVEYFDGEASEEEDYIEEEEVVRTYEECDNFESDSEDSHSQSETEQGAEEDGETPATRADVRGKSGYKWSKIAVKIEGRRSMQSVVHFPTPTADAMSIRSTIDAWSSLLTDEIVHIIVIHTNEEIQERYYLSVKDEDEDNSATHGETDMTEIKAFIGLLYFAGLQQQAKMSLAEMWSSEFGTSFFATVMSHQRFKFIASVLRFDDKQTRAERREIDLFAPMREIWDMFIENCRINYSPSNNLTVGKQLLAFRGNYGARVYIKDIKSKSARYGIKIISMNDAKTSYMYNAIPYTGEVRTERNEKAPELYVRLLTEPIHHTNRIITFDSSFTTVNICDKLHNEFGLDAVGTIRKNKREIPASFVRPAAPGCTRYAYQNDKGLTLVSFCPKRNKVVLVLSTFHGKGIAGQSGKPEIIEFYNATKGGVEIFDKMVSAYTMVRRTKRWSMRVFFGMLDQAGINAIVLHNLISENKNMTRIEFIKDLVLKLVHPQLERRIADPNLSRHLRVSLSVILGYTKSEPLGSDRLVKRKRCAVCPSKRDKKTQFCCIECGKPVCEEHRTVVCADCK